MKHNGIKNLKTSAPVSYSIITYGRHELQTKSYLQGLITVY